MSNMAAPMCFRPLLKLNRFSRTVFFRGTKRGSNLYEFSTTSTENKVEAEKPPTGQRSDNKGYTTDGTDIKSKSTESSAPERETELMELNEKLTKENKKLDADFKELKDKYMRALAEKENVRTRMKKQADEVKLFGIQAFCKDLLEVADILNKATDSVPREELDQNVHLKSLFDGLVMTNQQMLKVFGKHGLKKIDPAVGDKFDPFFHEASFQVPAQGESQGNTIAVIQKTGYKLHERTISPALVGVFKS